MKRVVLRSIVVERVFCYNVKMSGAVSNVQFVCSLQTLQASRILRFLKEFFSLLAFQLQLRIS